MSTLVEAAACVALPTAFDKIPGDLPRQSLPEHFDLENTEKCASSLLNELKADNFEPNAIWRDLLVFSDTYRTIYSREAVYKTLQRLATAKHVSNFEVQSGSAKQSLLGCIDVNIAFRTRHGSLVGSGAGIVSLTQSPDRQWRLWMLRTWLENFEGLGHPDKPVLATEIPDWGADTGVARPTTNGITEGTTNGTTNGTTRPESKTYGAFIIGGGQAGLGLAGRLQALGVDYLVVEKTPGVGDVWKNRYDSLRFHTTRDFSGMPFEWRWTPAEDKMVTAKNIGKGHESWAEKYGINVQTSTSIVSADFDDRSGLWTISTTGAKGEQTFQAQNLVLAIGPGLSSPIMPEWASPKNVAESGFTGQIFHGSAWKSAQPWAGQRGIVVGVANTGHDVAEDMANAGMDTTMVQRGPTFVLPVEWLHMIQDADYHLEKSPDLADREQCTMPNKIAYEVVDKIFWGLIDANPQRFDDLEKVGFKVQRRGSLVSHLYERLGGHYIDIGASARIANGEIKVKSVPIRGLTQHGLAFADDTEIPADIVVVATGFDHDFSKVASRFVGKEIAGKMEDFGGINEEGEMKGFARLAGHPRLYYHGFDVRSARFFSRFVALSIQADVKGYPLQPYVG